MMRLLYFILYFVLKYAFRVYFRKTATFNSPKEFFGRTIYVSNHAASFMDPLVVASLRRPIVFFMTRSDVFTTFMKPILWASHMLPIYRQHDGEDTKAKNIEVFDTCSAVLRYGRNLLIFGEGFTDDIFIRRLKPVKKGAIRIGFYALEKQNWKKKIYLAAVGVNYTEPNLMRSDCLVSTSDKICLNDYREAYESNPNKVVNDLTKEIEQRMQQQITHVQEAKNAPFHEAVQQITRLGMHPTTSLRSISLEKRWRYSQKLADFFNANTARLEHEFAELHRQLSDYNEGLKKKNINDSDVLEYIDSGKFSRAGNSLNMLLLSPFALLGFVHCGLVYLLVKRFVEKSFKRSVFHGSVKLLLGMIGMGLINIPIVFLFHQLIYPNWWLALLYYALIGLFFLAMILFNGQWDTWKRKKKIKAEELAAFAQQRQNLREIILQTDLNVSVN